MEQHPFPVDELGLDDETVDLLKSGKLNVRLICEMIKHPDFINFLSDVVQSKTHEIHYIVQLRLSHSVLVMRILNRIYTIHILHFYNAYPLYSLYS